MSFHLSICSYSWREISWTLVTDDSFWSLILQDVTELHLTTASKDKIVTGDLDNKGFYQQSMWLCPVTGLEMNGRHPFSFIKTCGCVVSDRALKALHSEACPAVRKFSTSGNNLFCRFEFVSLSGQGLKVFRWQPKRRKCGL